MNIQQLRQSLKMKWLSYYQQNRTWLVKMRIWATYNDLRRPSSGFILATLSVLEPQFEEILTFILDLNNNPDQIVAALGLNFNPDEELILTSSEYFPIANQISDDVLLETNTEDECFSLAVSDTEVSSESPTKFPDDQPILGLAHQEKLVSLATVNNPVAHGVTSDRQPVASVAVATQSRPESLAKLLLSDKPPSEIPRPQPPVRIPSSASLVMPKEVPRPTKTLPPLVNSEVSTNGKTLPSMTVAIKIPNDGKPAKIQLKSLAYKAKPSLSSNARSLPSWVDEFCQGSEWNPEEAIFVEF
ncbi:MAG: hypothetical protein KME23_15225 [Goleter apudmare HA4340-LM2]|jgi:hypothetical protein|nr:hypothetical protein [Goleter apudmare HA4340-LM2]